MIKKLCSGLIFSIVLHISAMDQPCYLAHMPIEVQNLIMKFLYESKEDFIAQTKTPKQCFLPHYYKYLSPVDIDNLEQYSGIGGFCPDDNKLAIVSSFKKFKGDIVPSKARLIILNLLQEGDRVMYRKRCDLYTAITLSNDGCTIAAIFPACVKNTYCLEIKQLKSDSVWNWKFSEGFEPVSISFNRLGNRLIVHGEIEGDSDSGVLWAGLIEPSFLLGSERVRVVPQKKNYVAKQVVFENKNKTAKNRTLQDFFKSNCVCKSIENSK
jgi:hypothetical protein